MGCSTPTTCSLAGGSFDYGPFAFLETWIQAHRRLFRPENGLYAYGQQPLNLASEPAPAAGALASLLLPRH